jgi:hypothetical protein
MNPTASHTMNPPRVIFKAIPNGWAIELSDGREIARFTGRSAKRRALRYLAAHDIRKEAGDRR